MILCGLLGMSTKFVECTLGVKYRDVGEDGTVYGGPMYYLTKGLKEKGFGTLGKILAATFAFLCIGASFGGGNAAQSNQAAMQLVNSFGMTGGSARTIIGVIMMVLVGIIIIGGIKRIASVTEKVVPLMALMYILACLYIILTNFSFVDDAFRMIFSQAFSPQAGLGGLLGVLITGFRRAAFSNEAGAGSASIAHSAVKTNYAASEGLVALLEPFIDTVVICTMTALVIIIFATVIAIGYEIFAMYEKSLVELADLLLLFIYLEVIQMIREYWTLNRIRISIPLFIAITAVARLIILQGKTMDPSMLLYEGGAILLIAIAVLILKARKLKMFSDVDD